MNVQSSRIIIKIDNSLYPIDIPKSRSVSSSNIRGLGDFTLNDYMSKPHIERNVNKSQVNDIRNIDHLVIPYSISDNFIDTYRKDDGSIKIGKVKIKEIKVMIGKYKSKSIPIKAISLINDKGSIKLFFYPNAFESLSDDDIVDMIRISDKTEMVYERKKRFNGFSGL